MHTQKDCNQESNLDGLCYQHSCSSIELLQYATALGVPVLISQHSTNRAQLGLTSEI